MSIEVRMFNVGHGDSILVESQGAATNAFVLIDSNAVLVNGARINRASEYLEKRGVSELAVLVITHLHSDHFLGVEQILDRMTIKKLIVPPFIRSRDRFVTKSIFDRYAGKIEDVINRTSDERVNAAAYSLARLLDFMCEHDDVVEEASGPESVIRVPGSDMNVRALLPLRRQKGVLHERLTSGSFSLDSFAEWNDSSLAMLLEHEGLPILLAGDSTLPQWREHKRRMERSGVGSWETKVLKAPHHGSRHNNTPDVYRYLMGDNPQGKYVLVSSNGRTHPHDDFFGLVEDLGLRPYCTSLARQCSNVASLDGVLRMPAPARTFMLHYEHSAKPVSCQGDVIVRLDGGALSVSNSTGNACVYEPRRGRTANPHR